MGVSGLILAGGRATRMDGANKALMPFLGRTMISHVIERLSPQVDEILINANQDIANFQAFNLLVLADAISGLPGPLAGLHTGLEASQHDWILCVPCDSPLLPSNLAKRLLQVAIREDANIAIAKTEVQNHPVFCLCKKSLAADLAHYLHQGGRKVSEWQRAHRYIEVHFDDETAFSNINTFEDLAKLEALSRQGGAT
jgi:molybdopterin-guanine dinucleotide biosynthesis protein A